MQQPTKKNRDFSDIDNLHRATESFLREQHKLLAGRKPVRAPRNQPFWNTRTRTAAITALSCVLVLTGIALAAGTHRGNPDDILVPKQAETAQVAEQTAPPPEETAVQSAEETVTVMLSSAAAQKPERRTTAVPGTSGAEEDAADGDTAEEAGEDADGENAAGDADGGNEAGGNAAGGNAAGANNAPQQTQPQAQQPVILRTEVQQPVSIQPSVTNPPVHTTSQTYPGTQQHLTVPVSSTVRTVTTQRTVPTTARRTTTTQRITTVQTTTTPKPTTVTTTTTAPPPTPNVQLVTSYIRDWEHFEADAKIMQKFTVLLRNAGTGALDKKKAFVFTLPVTVRHVSCVSGNGSQQDLAYSGEKIYFTLDAYAGSQDYIQIELNVLTDSPVFSYTVEFDP